MSRTAVIAGVGPRIGESTARKFAREGCSVAMLARSESYLEELAADLADAPGTALAVPTDVTDPDQVDDAFDRVRDQFGPVDVLVNNAYPTDGDGRVFKPGGGPLGAEWDDLRRGFDVWVGGAFRCAEQAAADMLDGDGGTILFTGARAAVRGTGGPGHSPPCFGVRGLALGVARHLWPEGVHVAHVVVDGSVGAPDQRGSRDKPDAEWIHPDDVAETYWFLVEQPDGAWTLELDVRAHGGPIGVG